MKKPLELLSGLILLFLLLAFACSCSKPPQNAGRFDWPQWRGPDGNGQSRETDWDPASIAVPRVLWKADVGAGYPNAVIQNGRLYAAGLKEGRLVISCLDASSGRRIWKRDVVSYSPLQATPAVAGNQLFVLTPEGYLYCLDSRNGRQSWKKDLVADYGALKPSYSFGASPVVEGDLLVLTANSSGMALMRDTGDLVWGSAKPPENFTSAMRANSNGTGYSTPVLYDGPSGRQALVVGWSGLTSVDVGTGSPSWHFAWEAEPGGSPVDPVVVGDEVYMGLAFELPLSQSGFALRIKGGKPSVLWRTPELFSFIGYPVAVGGCLYSEYGGPNVFGNLISTSLRCFDLRTGRVMWEEAFGPRTQNKSVSLAAANGVLIVLDDKGTLYTAAASPDGFREIARCDVLTGEHRSRLFWTPPVLCNAKIYCRSASGDLVCIDVSR
jgi:outer membrane protein assembly factor BamB